MRTSAWSARRAPIVVQLVLSVLVGMTLISVLAAAFVFWRVDLSLNAQLDQDVRAYRDVGLKALAEGGRVPEVGTFGYQIFNAHGALISGNIAGRVATPAAISRAATRGEQRGESGWMFSEAHSYIWIASPARYLGQRVVVVFAIDRREHDEALRELLGQLAIAGGATLIVAAWIGYRTARAALDPVERYRVAAEAADPHTRLPVEGRDDELTRLGHTFNDFLDRIESSRERERRFLADASHELRAPLSVMRAEVEVALRRQQDPDRSRETLDSLAAQISRLERLCNALLELEELHASADVAMEPVDLGGLFAEAVDRGRRLPAVGRRSITSAGGAGLVLQAHPHWLEVALDNLVSNAVRYGVGEIIVGARPATDASGRRCVEIWVTDEGSGMPEDFLPRAFDRFALVDQSRTSGGTGLGLAIVAEIADLHGATVAIDGARVSLLFPQVNAAGR